MFPAVLLEKSDAGFQARITELDDSRLPDDDVLVEVAHSTLNYNDALALTNRSPVVRLWPIVPGIDGAGTVLESRHADWQPGDRVVLNGFGVGETHWGCLAGRARLKGEWLVKLPAAFTTRQAMAIGTAGYTAMLCVLALEDHGVTPQRGEVLVTGASGGVGSVAVALLAGLGYTVVAATGKLAEADYLKSLGATTVLDRADFAAAGKPLQKERWAGVVDTLGGTTLANACAQMRYGGTVTACGLAQSMDLPTSVAPFILRGVTLAGIDSVMAPRAVRQRAWDRLARDLDVNKLESMVDEIALDGVFDRAQALMAGSFKGRTVVTLG